MRQVVMMCHSFCDDPVTPGLWDALQRAGSVCQRWVSSGTALLAPAAARQLWLQALVDAQRLRVVGVGLAATDLLAISALLPAQAELSILALFPVLGFDAPVYGAAGVPTVWPGRGLALARRRWLAPLAGRLAVLPLPVGTDGVYCAGQLSWRQLASVLPGAECTQLLVPVMHPATLVLNAAAPGLDLARAQVVLPVLNERLDWAVSAPQAADLAARVAAWLDGAPF